MLYAIGMNTRVQNQIRFGLDDRHIDKGIITGAAISFALIVIGVVMGGQGLMALNPMSMLIVLGGTFGATLVHYSWYDIRHAWNAFQKILFAKESHPSERIGYLVELAQAVRIQGLLVLEREARASADPFLRMALELTADGQQAPDIKRILETEMRASQDKAVRGSNVFQTMGTYAPALGLIGTIIGMMEMLTALADPSTVGPAMAVALTTTLYGAILSNLIFLPVAGKLRNQIDEELTVKAITVEGILAVGRQENPSIVEQRLQGFLPLMPGI